MTAGAYCTHGKRPTKKFLCVLFPEKSRVSFAVACWRLCVTEVTQDDPTGPPFVIPQNSTVSTDETRRARVNGQPSLF